MVFPISDLNVIYFSVRKPGIIDSPADIWVSGAMSGCGNDLVCLAVSFSCVSTPLTHYEFYYRPLLIHSLLWPLSQVKVGNTYIVIFAVVICGRVIPATNSLTTCNVVKCLTLLTCPRQPSTTEVYTTGCAWKWKIFGVDLQYLSLQSRSCSKCKNVSVIPQHNG